MVFKFYSNEFVSCFFFLYFNSYFRESTDCFSGGNCRHSVPHHSRTFRLRREKERKKEKTNSTHALQDVCMCVHLRGDLCQAGLSRHQRDLRSKRRVSSVF